MEATNSDDVHAGDGHDETSDSGGARSSAGGAPRRGDDGEMAAMLACGATHEEVAEALGISIRTVSRRRREPHIERAIRERRAELTHQVGGRLSVAAHSASTVLATLLHDDDPRVQIAAATALLDRAVKFRRAADLEDRLLEQEGAHSVHPSAWPGMAR